VILNAKLIVVVLIIVLLLLFVFISPVSAQTDSLQRSLKAAVNQGDLYTMNTFRPTITFPMHLGGGEDRYKDFAREARQNNVPTQIKCATARGDQFFYGNGVMAELIKGEHDE
jgi:NAD-dependent oxidoreductase involved in siderophore biosynthesis